MDVMVISIPRNRASAWFRSPGDEIGLFFQSAGSADVLKDLMALTIVARQEKFECLRARSISARDERQEPAQRSLRSSPVHPQPQ
jgi:hypothetical protein